MSREEIIHKPIALIHASHRGDEALAQLRRVLSTVSEGFSDEIFLRIPIAGKTAEERNALLSSSENMALIRAFVTEFVKHIETS